MVSLQNKLSNLSAERRAILAVNFYNFETLAGILTVHYNQEQQEVEMAQAPAEFITYNGNVDELAKSIGITSDDIATEYPVLYGSTGIWTVILPIKSLETFSRMKPDNQQFKNILTQIPTASVHPICMQTYDKTCAMHGRHFSASQSGTVEDPVTGTASGVMGAYYINYVHPSAAGTEI